MKRPQDLHIQLQTDKLLDNQYEYNLEARLKKRQNEDPVLKEFLGITQMSELSSFLLIKSLSKSYL